MINYNNIKEYKELPFSDYMSLEGKSYSFFKNEKSGISPVISPTDKMRLGSLVDAMITDPKSVVYGCDFYDEAKKIAHCLKSNFNGCLHLFDKQLSYTANMCYSGFELKTKGRPDLTLKGKSNVDLKVTSVKDPLKVIEHFGYNKQQYHYAKLANVPEAYLLIYSTYSKKAEIYLCDFYGAPEFFAEKILLHGSTIKVNIPEF